VPLLFEDEGGISHANDWANCFLRGMELRKEDWADLLNDEQHGGWLVPDTRDGAPAIDLIDGEALCDLLKSLKLGVKVTLVEDVSVQPDWFLQL